MVIYIDASRDEVKKSAEEDRKCLAQYEVTPSEEFKTGKVRRLYPKNCYRKAFQYVASKNDIAGIKLVHGLYRPSFSIIIAAMRGLIFLMELYLTEYCSVSTTKRVITIFIKL